MRLLYLPTLVISILLMGIAPASADSVGAGDGPYYGMHMYESGWHGMLMGPLMMIAFIVVAIIAVIIVLRWMGVSGSSDNETTAQSPSDILMERFAKGEIDEDEFRHRLEVLSKPR